MEPYTVRADRILPKPESWLYIKIPAMVVDLESAGKQHSVTYPGYEIVYASHKENARAFARELQLRQAVSGALFPMLVRMLPAQATIIVYNDKYPYLHETKFKSPKDGIWSLPYHVEASEKSITLPEKSQNVMGHYLGPLVLYSRGLSNSATNTYHVLFGYGEAAANAHRLWNWQICFPLSESVSFKNRAPRYPDWFGSGFQRLLSSMRIDAKGVSFGSVTWSGRIGNRGFFSLAEVLWQPEPRQSRPTGIAGASESAYFIHFGLFGKKGANREKFMTLVDLMRSQSFSEELFQKAWGKSSKQIDREMRNYMQSDVMKEVVYDVQMPMMPPIILRDATQSEIARLKAELYMMRYQLPNALDELRIAYLRGEREPAMLAMLASLEQRIGSESRAAKIVKALLELPAPPPQTHIVAARLQFNEFLAAKPSGPELTSAETTALVATLSGALAGGLTTEDLCATLAEIILKSETTPDPDMLAFLQQAAKRFPLNKAISAAAAMRPRHDSIRIDPYRPIPTKLLP